MYLCFMKKIMTFVLLTVFSMVSVACNGQSAPASEKNEKSAKEKKAKTIKLTTADFLTKVVDYKTTPDKWIYLGDKPAIIDFYADWCGPCRLIAPILEELAEEYSGKIYIYKVDIEKEKELAMAFGVQRIPYLLFIPMKGDPQVAQSALPKKVLKEVIDEVLLE